MYFIILAQVHLFQPLFLSFVMCFFFITPNIVTWSWFFRKEEMTASQWGKRIWSTSLMTFSETMTKTMMATLTMQSLRDLWSKSRQEEPLPYCECRLPLMYKSPAHSFTCVRFHRHSIFVLQYNLYTISYNEVVRVMMKWHETFCMYAISVTYTRCCTHICICLVRMDLNV